MKTLIKDWKKLERQARLAENKDDPNQKKLFKMYNKAEKIAVEILNHAIENKLDKHDMFMELQMKFRTFCFNHCHLEQYNVWLKSCEC